MNKDLLYRFFEGQASVEEMKKIKEWTERSSENRSRLYRERKLFDAMHIVAASSVPLQRIHENSCDCGGDGLCDGNFFFNR